MQFLCDPTGKLLVDAEIDIEKDKVDLKLPGALQIVGTVSEKSDENRLFMLEEYFVSICFLRAYRHMDLIFNIISL